jgi:hypothetical protein
MDDCRRRVRHLGVGSFVFAAREKTPTQRLNTKFEIRSSKQYQMTKTSNVPNKLDSTLGLRFFEF